jgi:hypothetical protein
MKVVCALSNKSLEFFHLIQQTGGLLTLTGQQISVATFEDTNGSTVTRDSEVILENGIRITLSQLLK